MKNRLVLCTLSTMSFLLYGCSPSATDGQTATISNERAQYIALVHAGLTSDQTTSIESHIDMDDGRRVYTVEFNTPDGKEYDYEIDPGSGIILDYDIDMANFVN